jgi:hypothetical protein
MFMPGSAAPLETEAEEAAAALAEPARMRISASRQMRLLFMRLVSY